MFERRLKIFLAILIAVTAVLLVRAVQVQVLARTQWQEKAAALMVRKHLLSTTRGPIKDFRGRDLAIDTACIDACVDYRAVGAEPEEKWLNAQAKSRLLDRLGAAYTQAPRARRDELLEQEKQAVKHD